MRDCYEHLPRSPSTVAVAGGGSRSELWCQLFVDCLDTTVTVPDGAELGARGAAMLTAVGTSVLQDVPAAVETFTSIDRCYGPSASWTELYRTL